jgi:hypothetical protein
LWRVGYAFRGPSIATGRITCPRLIVSSTGRPGNPGRSACVYRVTSRKPRRVNTLIPGAPSGVALWEETRGGQESCCRDYRRGGLEPASAAVGDAAGDGVDAGEEDGVGGGPGLEAGGAGADDTGGWDLGADTPAMGEPKPSFCRLSASILPLGSSPLADWNFCMAPIVLESHLPLGWPWK